MNARSKRAVGPATCFGEDRETGPTRATYQLTVRMSPSKRGEQTRSKRGNTFGTTAPTSERQPDRTASVAYIALVALPGRHVDANWQQPSLIDAKSAPLSFFETVPRAPGGKLADEFITDEKAIWYSGAPPLTESWKLRLGSYSPCETCPERSRLSS